MSVSANHWQALGTSWRVRQNRRGGGGEVDREMTRIKEEEIGSFSVMNAAITEPAKGSSKEKVREVAPPVGEGKRACNQTLTDWTCIQTNVWTNIFSLLYLLSRNICVGAGGRPPLWLAVGWDVQEIPDQNGVVMGTADDLKLIKLKAEHSSRMLLGGKKNKKLVLS